MIEGTKIIERSPAATVKELKEALAKYSNHAYVFTNSGKLLWVHNLQFGDAIEERFGLMIGELNE